MINYLWQRAAKAIAILLIALPVTVYAQVYTLKTTKQSYLLRQKIQLAKPGDETTFYIATKNIDSALTLFRNLQRVKILADYKPAKILVIKTSFKTLEPLLLNEQVVFADLFRKPKEELVLSNLDISVNKINAVHYAYPAYNGLQTVVSVKEDLPDTNDIDIKGRYLSTPFSSQVLSPHAADMATIIAGAGNSDANSAGVAPGATISSANFANLLPEADNVYRQYNISVQNHSYGTGIENYYGVDAAAYDASVISNPSLLHIFSAGNSGNDADTTGAYKGIIGYANITGSFKMAKNILTVGNIDSIYHLLPRSSKGPAYDGRIKPELVAFAQDGSSGAAAIVSGVAALLQQSFKTIKGSLPTASLVKAILINSADDIAPTGIDFSSGYGNVNALKAIEHITGNRYFEGAVANSETAQHKLTVPAGLKQLKITLSWTDPAATPNTAKALVNDLDVSLSFPSLKQTWLPWVLNSAANIDSLQQLPVRKRDSLNNTEQITIPNPIAGSYVINVKGFAVTSGQPQQYSIGYQFDSLNTVEWYYPSGGDNILKNSKNIIRWASTLAENTAKLEYSTDNGATWTVIDNKIDPAKGYYNWNAPDILANAILRINNGNAVFLSNSFVISAPVNVQVGYNCPDSFLLSWNNMPGTNSYRLFYLGEKYMQPLTDLTGLFYNINKQANPSLYFAVAPLVNGRVGARSYSLNYTATNVGCYVNTFTASLTGTTATLQLQLGTLYNIASITWQKHVNNNYKNLKTVKLIQTNEFSYKDDSLLNGLNEYRVKIELLNGQAIYSNSASVYYTGNSGYSIFPNPAVKNEPLFIVSNTPGTSYLQVFNTAGAKVFSQTINNGFNVAITNKLTRGIYFFKISGGGKQDKAFKIILY